MDRTAMPEVQDLKKEKKRKAIIRASLRVFSRKGYETSALEEVAREASLAKGTLYLYFKDKEDLYFQVMLNVLERLESYVARQILQVEDPLEKMKAVARAQINFLANNPNYFRLFQVAFTPEMATIHKQLLEPLFEKRRRLSEFLHGLVEEGKRQKKIRGDIDTRDVVLSYMGMVNQAVQSACLARMGKIPPEERRVSPAQKAEAIMKILVQGIAAGSEGGSSK
ncbi:MAG: TetR/AcrR family transcriptional regulator [Spirochaetaceae bacterium]|nr:MAG: TetR/AcrR family transcriptional regulator [Spirochaetaceae bacterium]